MESSWWLVAFVVPVLYHLYPFFEVLVNVRYNTLFIDTGKSSRFTLMEKWIILFTNKKKRNGLY